MVDKKNVSKKTRALDTQLPPEKEALAIKIVAICWEQFGRGANIDIHPECFDRAIALGALANLRARLSLPDQFNPDELKSAKWCSHQAGREARKLARKLPPPNDILLVTPDIYEEAFKIVSEKNEKLNKRRRRDDLLEIVAVWCP